MWSLIDVGLNFASANYLRGSGACLFTYKMIMIIITLPGVYDHEELNAVIDLARYSHIWYQWAPWLVFIVVTIEAIFLVFPFGMVFDLEGKQGDVP